MRRLPIRAPDSQETIRVSSCASRLGAARYPPVNKAANQIKKDNIECVWREEKGGKESFASGVTRPSLRKESKL